MLYSRLEPWNILMFNFNAKQLFLTYPQCSLSKESVLEALNQVAAVQDFTISEEVHKDGSPHVHAVVKFATRYHTKNSRAFDISNHHPNLKTLKTSADFKRSTAYCKKDGNYITNVVEKLSPNQQLAEDLLKFGLTREVVRSHPQILFKNFNSIRSWINFMQPKQSFSLSKRKQRHIWLYGPSNTGKTTWLRAIRESFEAYELPVNNDFSHIQPSIEVLFTDEFRGFLTVQDLNRVCDGDTFVNTKGGSLYLPAITVIVVSNFSPSDVYSKVPDYILLSVLNRFNVYNSSINLPRFPLSIINEKIN